MNCRFLCWIWLSLKTLYEPADQRWILTPNLHSPKHQFVALFKLKAERWQQLSRALMFLFQLSALWFFHFSLFHAFLPLYGPYVSQGLLHRVLWPPRAWIICQLWMDKFPDGGREKSCSNMKAPHTRHLFPLALVKAWEPYVRAMLCHAKGGWAPALLLCM